MGHEELRTLAQLCDLKAEDELDTREGWDSAWSAADQIMYVRLLTKALKEQGAAVIFGA